MVAMLGAIRCMRLLRRVFVKHVNATIRTIASSRKSCRSKSHHAGLASAWIISQFAQFYPVKLRLLQPTSRRTD